MAVNVGGVMVEFDGDASGAAAAMKAVTEKLDELTRKESDLADAIVAATKAGVGEQEGLTALRRQLADTTASIEKMNGSAASTARALPQLDSNVKSTASSMSRLSDIGGKVDDTFGPLQTAISGIGSAMGGSAQKVADLVGGIADLGMVSSKLGWIGAIGAGVGVLVSQIMSLIEAEEEAKRVEGSWVESSKELADTLTNRTTSSVEKMRDQLRELVTSARNAGKELAQIRAEEAADMALDAQKRLEILKSTERFRQADVNRAQSQLESAKLGSGTLSVSEAQDALDRASAAFDNAKRRTEELTQQVADATDLFNGFNEQLKSAEQNTRDAAAKKASADLAKEGTPKERADAALAAVSSILSGVNEGTKNFVDTMESNSSLSAAITSEQANTLAGMTQDLSEVPMIISTAVTATADDIEQMNADFLSAGEAVLDLRDPAEKLRDSLAESGKAVGSFVQMLASKGMQGAGSAAGAEIGGAIDAMTGGATGGLGSIIGSLVGGVLGKALDQLIGALGILTPVFDALGVIIAALQPILVVLSGFFISLGDAIVGLAPLVLILARLWGAMMIPLVRLAQMFLMMVPAIVTVIDIVIVWADILTDVAEAIDEKFYKPILSVAVLFVNGIIKAYNSIIDVIRKIPGMSGFGTKAELVSTATAQTPGVDQMINDVSEAIALNAKDEITGGGGGGAGGGAGAGGSTSETGTDSWGMDLANVPSGFKAMASIYANADAEGGPGAAAAAITPNVIINIENWNSRGEVQRDYADLRRIARNGHKSIKAASGRSFGDEKN